MKDADAKPAQESTPPPSLDAALEDTPDRCDATDDAEHAEHSEHGVADNVDDSAVAEPSPDAQQPVEDLVPIVECLAFASPKPLTVQQLKRLTGAAPDVLKQAIAQLQTRYDGGIRLVEVAEGYQFRTDDQYASWVRKLLAGRPQRLTRPMLEALAIVAYRQPITRPEIEEIRGVDCGGTLRVLLERNLLRILGKKEEIGRPLLYGTSKHFLEFFQLRNLKELPTLREFAELSETHQQQVDLQFQSGDPATGEPTASEVDGQQVDGQQVDGQQVDGQQVDGQQVDGQQVDGQTVDPAAAATTAQTAPDSVAQAPSTPSMDSGVPPTPAPLTPVPQDRLRDQEEDDERALSALDRAIDRASSTLKQVAPPKRAAKTASDDDAARAGGEQEVAQSVATDAPSTAVEGDASAASGGGEQPTTGGG